MTMIGPITLTLVVVQWDDRGVVLSVAGVGSTAVAAAGGVAGTFFTFTFTARTSIYHWISFLACGG